MTTHFIEAEIDLTASPHELPQVIEAALQHHGDPLRWAVTAVDPVAQTAQVEAIVTATETTQTQADAVVVPLQTADCA
ncbi:MAG: hypothetical protein Fur0042_24640 [Cyanophyceae cyanobacterium]